MRILQEMATFIYPVSNNGLTSCLLLLFSLYCTFVSLWLSNYYFAFAFTLAFFLTLSSCVEG